MWKSRSLAIGLLFALVSSAVAQDVDTLRAQLADSSEHVRARAAAQLGDAGSDARAAIPDLVDAMSDWTPAVRKAAMTALGKIGDPRSEVVSGLESAARSRREEEAILAVAAVARLGESAAPTLERLLIDPDVVGRVRKGVLDARADAVPAVLVITESRRWRSRVEAASLLGAVGVGSAPVAERLTALVRPRGVRARNAACRSGPS